MRWCIRRGRSCSGAKLQHDVRCVVLRHWRPDWAFSVDVDEKGANGPLAVELGGLTDMNGSKVVSGDCVREFDVNP